MDDRFTKLLIPFLPLLGDHELTPEARLRDLGLDSMHAIDMLFAIEDEFGIAFQDDDMSDATFETAGSLWAVVVRTAGIDESAA